MEKTLTIGLDLGSDTLKIAFAYLNDDDTVSYGKFDCMDRLFQIAIPAVAYYDTQTEEWFFADKAEKRNSQSYVTMVKIKSLLGLLATVDNLSVANNNKTYYLEGHDFPKFYFPIRRGKLVNFDKLVKEYHTFKCKETPREVCQMFFAYIKKLVDDRVLLLSQRRDVVFDKTKIALAHPFKVGKLYTDELSRLVKKAFGLTPAKIMNPTKALGLFAFYRNEMKENDKLLVFDMGEDTIAVSKTFFLNGNIVVDGEDGHNGVEKIGGLDVDKSVCDFLEGQISQRETLGMPSYGEDGYLQENGLYTKEYLLMKDIKRAKAMLSSSIVDDKMFENGVPIEICREFYLQRYLNRNDFEKCIAGSNGRGVAAKICKYIVDEVTRPVNKDVTKIFIAGGLTETYSLLDRIKASVKKVCPKVKVCTYDDECTTDDKFNILFYEDSVYATAVGCAIVALKNYKIKTVLTYSYGSWCVDTDSNVKRLYIFKGADKGTIIDDKDVEKNIMLSGSLRVWGPRGVEKEEIFSTIATSQDIEKRTDNYYLIGDIGSNARNKAIANYDLKTIAGGEDGMICYYCKVPETNKKARVTINFGSGKGLFIKEGIKVDVNGRATPIVQNVTATNEYCTVTFVGTNRTATVKVTEIELGFSGVDDVSIINN
jgi:hypothetical protein